jgi:hypothetical protein
MVCINKKFTSWLVDLFFLHVCPGKLLDADRFHGLKYMQYIIYDTKCGIVDDRFEYFPEINSKSILSL